MITTADKKAIRESYRNDWPRMRAEARKRGSIFLLVGDWSGFNRPRYTQTDYWNRKRMEIYGVTPDYRGHHRFTDGTTMTIWFVEVTIDEIFHKELRAIHGYDSLVMDIIKEVPGAEQT